MTVGGWPAGGDLARAATKGVTGVQSFAIVCDSSHDLPPGITEELRLTVVPYTINFGAASGLQSRSAPLAREDGKLLTEGQIVKDEMPLRT